MSKNSPCIVALIPIQIEYRDVLLAVKRIGSDMGAAVISAGDEFEQGTFAQMIAATIQSADLVIADVSVPNPNTYYEIGFAHALQKPVLFIARDAAGISFDIRSQRIVVYGNGFGEFEVASILEQPIKSAMEAALAYEPAPTPPQPPARIFVSHSHKDNAWCHDFVTALQVIGFDVWYDKTDLRGGAAWVATIESELQSRQVFIVVLTPAAWSSDWVRQEIQLALARRRKIIPLLLEPVQVDGFLLTIQWVEVGAKNGADMAHMLGRVLRTIQ